MVRHTLKTECRNGSRQATSQWSQGGRSAGEGGGWADAPPSVERQREGAHRRRKPGAWVNDIPGGPALWDEYRTSIDLAAQGRARSRERRSDAGFRTSGAKG